MKKMDDGSYKYDMDDGNFISKLISKFTKNKNQKLLTSGNIRVKYTSESISSMWRKTALKASLYKQLEKFTNLFIKVKNSEKISHIEPLVIGKEEEKKADNTDVPIIPETKLTDVAPIIPKAVSKTIKYNNEVTSESEDSE